LFLSTDYRLDGHLTVKTGATNDAMRRGGTTAAFPFRTKYSKMTQGGSSMRLWLRLLFVTLSMTAAYCQTTGHWALIEKKQYYFEQPPHQFGCYTGSGKGSEGDFVTIHTATATCFKENRSLISELKWSDPPGVLLPREVAPFKMSHRLAENGIGSMLSLGNRITARIDAASVAPDRVGGGALKLGEIGMSSDRNTAGAMVTIVNEESKEPVRMWGKASYDVVLRVTVDGRHSWVWDAIYRWRDEAVGWCAGSCELGAPGQTVGAGGGTLNVGVKTRSGTQWTATSGATWVRVTSGATGTGDGTVTLTVERNGGPPRSGTVYVAGQKYAVHQDGTPSGATAGCNYLIQPTSASAAAGGASGIIQVITAPNCAWRAEKAASWLTIRSGESGTGNGAVSWAAAANNTGDPRSAAVVIAGQSVAINQAGGSVPGTPVINRGGVVNTASYRAGHPPQGSIAQGSFFSIYGDEIGPETAARVQSYPLPRTLGGLRVEITQGNTRQDAYLVFASKGQINAIMPSNFPIGEAEVTIHYGGKSSVPRPIAVSKTDLGIFYMRLNDNDVAIAQNVASATDYPLNTFDVPARPGQIVILWATGLGPVSVSDANAPGGGDMTGVPVEIRVGNVVAERLYAGRQPETAGVDNVYFRVPAGAPTGCFVPVVVTAGGKEANRTTIAITSDGRPCR
jgi:uncharacterized protein (TIGR03437 family)